jgi:hypothetical protein
MSGRQVPQEGIDAALADMGYPVGSAAGRVVERSIRRNLEAAYPAIRLQVLEEVQQALASDAAVLAGAKRLFNREEPSMDQLWDVLKTIRAVSRTALATLSKEKTDEEGGSDAS